MDSTVFWVGLLAPAAMWALFALGALLRLNFEWLLIVAVALGLNGANVVGYLRCRKGALLAPRARRTRASAGARAAPCRVRRPTGAHSPPARFARALPLQILAPISKGWSPRRALLRAWARCCAICPSRFDAIRKPPPFDLTPILRVDRHVVFPQLELGTAARRGAKSVIVSFALILQCRCGTSQSPWAARAAARRRRV